MNEIGLSSRLPSMGTTQAYALPRVGAESERTTAASSVTTPAPDSSSVSTSQTSAVGASSEILSISSGAQLAQKVNSSTEAVDGRAGRDMSSEQATALLQSVRDVMTRNPQDFFQAQSGQISAPQVASVLRA